MLLPIPITNTEPHPNTAGCQQADALALENDVLRRKLVRMELKLEDLEAQRPPGSGREHLGEAVDIDALVAEGYREEDEVLGGDRGPGRGGGGGREGVLDSNEMQELERLTNLIQIAKREAVEESARGKKHLNNDIRHLYGLLDRAKAERDKQAQVIEALTREVRQRRQDCLDVNSLRK